MTLAACKSVERLVLVAHRSESISWPACLPAHSADFMSFLVFVPSLSWQMIASRIVIRKRRKTTAFLRHLLGIYRHAGSAGRWFDGTGGPQMQSHSTRATASQALTRRCRCICEFLRWAALDRAGKPPARPSSVRSRAPERAARGAPSARSRWSGGRAVPHRRCTSASGYRTHSRAPAVMEKCWQSRDPKVPSRFRPKPSLGWPPPPH